MTIVVEWSETLNCSSRAEATAEGSTYAMYKIIYRLCMYICIHILHPYLDTLVKNILNMLNHSHPEGHFALLQKNLF